jgi:NTE family protein
MAHASSPRHEQPVALVLGGGNALGSYLAGAYEHLHRQEIEPRRIVAASIGAITGAIVAGNAREDRLARLEEFWTEAMIHTPGALGRGSTLRHAYNEAHTALALLLGRRASSGPVIPVPGRCCRGCRTISPSTTIRP